MTSSSHWLGSLMPIIRKKLDPSEVYPTSLRIADGVVQRTPDGGTHWINSPADDPRLNQTIKLPVLTTSDPQCDAAATMVAAIKAQVDDFLAHANIVEGVIAILDILLVLIPGAEILYPVVYVVVTALLAIGTSAIVAAMTTTVYNDLLCIIYCSIGTNGSVSAAQFASIQSQITAHFGAGTVNTVLQYILSSMGEVGLHNAGIVNHVTGNCSACACVHCFKLDFSQTNGVTLGFHLQSGVWSGGALSGVYQNASSVNDLNGYWAFAHRIHVASITIEFYKAAGSGGNDVNHMNTLYPTATGYNTTILASSNTNPKAANVRQTKTMTPNHDLDGVGFDINMGQTSDVVQVYSITIHYTGTPLAADNC